VNHAYTVHPLHDPEWAELVDRHPRSSIFHTVAWLRALHRTYGYEPIAYTTSAPGQALRDGLVFCRVASWITGRRLISLPFSDHCEPLLENAGDGRKFVSAIEQALFAERLRYVEIRGTCDLFGATCLSRSTQTYCFHTLDLEPDLATLFHNCHRSSTQRKILRAQREGVVCETGRSPKLLDVFYDLLLMTRRRHRVPPQPKAWFRNLIDCFADALDIRVAFKGKQPVAAILTLRHKNTLVYKYGCSDTRFNNLGGTQLLFWRSIQAARHEGLSFFDLGRSDLDNKGLIAFKDRWGSARATLTYSRFAVSPLSDKDPLNARGSLSRVGTSIVPLLPSWLLRAVGSAVYRHIA